MAQVRNEMKLLENEIDDLINKYPNITANDFPLSEYKLLNIKLIAIHIKMASSGSGIHIEEGSKWFREQVAKLTNFIP